MTTVDHAIGLWPSPEQELLLQMALRRGPASRTAFNRWREQLDLTADFPWETVRLLPLVYDSLREQGVTDSVMPRLKGVYRRAWFDAVRREHTIRPAIAALRAAGMDLLLLKGAALAASYYDAPALRPMDDVDIVVDQADVLRALEILAANGWQASTAATADLLRFRHAVQCIGPDGCQVDLHWHVLHEAPSGAADAVLRRRLESRDFLGTSVRELEPTALLFVVIVHGVCWNRETPIRWIADAMMILRRRGAEIDWAHLAHLGVTLQLAERLRLGLHYLVAHFDAPVPANLLQSLDAHAPRWIERAERHAILRNSDQLGGSAAGMQWLRFVDYCRYAGTRNPLAFVAGYMHYLRFTLQLRGRRELLPLMARGIGRRLAGQWRRAEVRA
jgi:hypothetical protein